MGRVREESTSPSLSEALLFATMCIVGLPVEVHIKDGSIFSGIFHTASVHNGYGIALKKAKMVKKGTYNANVGNGGLIDTLVVLPADLVQVVAKGVVLPVDSTSSDVTSNDGEALSEVVDSPRGTRNGAILTADPERQVGMCRSEREEDGYNHASGALKEAIEVNGSTSCLNGSYTIQSVHHGNHATGPNPVPHGSLVPNGVSHVVKLVNQFPVEAHIHAKSVASGVPTSDKIKSDADERNLAPPTNRTTKESKLNPGARVFSPSLTNFRLAPSPAPAVTSVAYMPNSIPAVQVAVSQPEVGMRPLETHSSWPVKFLPYATSAPGIADNGLQYSQPIVAHITRTQPVRHGAQYQPIPVVPPYLHANHQNGMFGRPGQLLYVNPATHDMVQAPAALSQAPHSFLTSHPIHVAKHEGVVAGQALQVSVTPSLIATGPEPFMMPNPMQLSQPLFSSMRPIPIIGPNVHYNAKFS